MDHFRNSPEGTSEAAFSLLISRHGPMVQRVCRNVLSRQEDVEDAFQATFLILVRQSRSIRKLDSVASWLYGVAARVAARARVEFARRRKLEQLSPRLAVDTVDPVDPERAEFGSVVQQEVSRLPGKYREVVLLCYWEGLTQEQAAHQLGCPIGTVRSRVARARDILRKRLQKRGLVSVSLLAATDGLSAPVTQALVISTTRSAHSILCKTASYAVSPIAASLVQRFLWSLKVMKLMKSCLLLVVGSTLLAGITWAQRPRSSSDVPPSKSSASSHKVPPMNLADLAHIIAPPDLLLVEVLEALPGRPISGERLVRPDGKISLGFYGDVYVAGLTAREAKEKIVLHLKKFLNEDALGLVELDPETGRQTRTIKPGDSDRVFVDVTAYNSRFYYVEGQVGSPGRFPFTGSERVLDAIHLAGGPLTRSPHVKVRLMRTFPREKPLQVIPVDLEEITVGTDTSTNYDILPYDRIVVQETEPTADGHATTAPERSDSPSQAVKRPAPLYFDRAGTGEPSDSRANDLEAVNRRLDEIERKLDAILSKLNQ